MTLVARSKRGQHVELEQSMYSVQHYSNTGNNRNNVGEMGYILFVTGMRRIDPSSLYRSHETRELWRGAALAGMTVDGAET